MLLVVGGGIIVLVVVGDASGMVADDGFVVGRWFWGCGVDEPSG